ncbi:MULTISPECIES: ATP synthase F0 subunit B [unclassified Leptolyngbya]|uniref:ATP synthase F0 subunit B n=1 Tax=unclassified Leptolyngbya TaxID=2650499 RepID=UPI001683EA45|nr:MULTISPECIES: ATP synthase F0 subunit B [unclassified Leptolyngbya]MBD1910418.1 ATP synthase F0 subunit B [Leptolyngbya sp. FACHB-8]MBD2154186.1 ATP synthase F0 subunit B [Leptolyngbya sp. FACHB-16]
MLREDTSNRITPDRNGASPNSSGTSRGEDATRVGRVDIQRELEKLEEMLLDSPRLFNRTLVNEDQLLEQLEVVQVNLPTAFEEARKILQEKEEILLEAEQYAQEIIEMAERRAAQIIDEMGLIRQAEMEIKQVRQRVQQECEEAQEQTLMEIERMRRQAQQELEEMRQRAMAECAEIQSGADLYADRVLGDLEMQFTDMLRVVRNGRHRLQPDTPAPAKPTNSSAGTRSPQSPPKPNR